MGLEMSPIRNGGFIDNIPPRLRAETELLIRLSKQTGIPINVLDGGTEATPQDLAAVRFAANFMFLEVSGG